MDPSDTNAPPKRLWHTLDPEQVLEDLDTNEHGLSSHERADRLKKYGKNALPVGKVDSLLVIFLKQFKSPLIYLLIVAMLLIAAIGDWVDAGIIAFVLLFNAVAGTIQAGRARNTMQALQKITKTDATVIVGDERQVVEDTEVVPGDIIFLGEGDKVPADARLIKSSNLRLNESPLTGEADPAGKRVDTLEDEDQAAVEQKNMVFKGTLVVAGNATAVVTATGLQTVIGDISQQITGIHTEIPLQVNIRRLSHMIIKIVLVLSAAIFALGVLADRELEQMFTLTIAVIVSAVPEGLPIVMTLLLASGVWRMGKRHVLVKRLQAVEALGEAKVIAVDKTGTITKNELALTHVITGVDHYTVEASGYEPEGQVLLQNEAVNPNERADLQAAARVALLCADATVEYDTEAELWDVHGDPTEGAMSVFARKLNYRREQLHETVVPVDEIPFDASLKYHAVLHDTDDGKYLTVAGAPERIIELATTIRRGDAVEPLDDGTREHLLSVVNELSGQALRVIAIAEKSQAGDSLDPESVTELTLVSLLGMQDSLRSEVPEAMERTRSAGIKVVMITGDHKATAQAIATDAGIFREGDTVLTDSDIDTMSEDELARAAEHTTVFARITPEHKLSIVKAFQARGDIVAMTGDGVNDALSLVQADLGVAMGRRGTEVAKEAADLVLLDDNFGSIVSAVEEGRGIYVNMKKVLLFLFSTSLGEIMIIVAAILLAIPSPVLAAQLIWINLVTDGVLDVGLALEPKEKDLLRRKFVKPKRFFIDGWMAQRMFLMSSVMAIGTLAVFMTYYTGTEDSLPKAITMAVTVMVVCQWFKVWSCRSQYLSVFARTFFSNHYMVWGTLVVIVLHVFAMHNPFLQHILSLEPISIREWVLVIAIGSMTLLVDEARKYIYRTYEAPEEERVDSEQTVSSTT